MSSSYVKGYYFPGSCPSYFFQLFVWSAMPLCLLCLFVCFFCCCCMFVCLSSCLSASLSLSIYRCFMDSLSLFLYIMLPLAIRTLLEEYRYDISSYQYVIYTRHVFGHIVYQPGNDTKTVKKPIWNNP